jgi:hypothetical protein
MTVDALVAALELRKIRRVLLLETLAISVFPPADDDLHCEELLVES